MCLVALVLCHCVPLSPPWLMHYCAVGVAKYLLPFVSVSVLCYFWSWLWWMLILFWVNIVGLWPIQWVWRAAASTVAYAEFYLLWFEFYFILYLSCLSRHLVDSRVQSIETNLLHFIVLGPIARMWWIIRLKLQLSCMKIVITEFMYSYTYIKRCILIKMINTLLNYSTQWTIKKWHFMFDYNFG